MMGNIHLEYNPDNNLITNQYVLVMSVITLFIYEYESSQSNIKCIRIETIWLSINITIIKI